MKLVKFANFFIVILTVTALVIFAATRVKAGKGTDLALLNPQGQSKNIFSFFKHSVQRPKKIIYGYLPYWSVNKLEYMQLDKLTDISYFGLYIKEDGTFIEKNDAGETDPGFNNWFNNKDLAVFIKQAQMSGVQMSLTIISHDDEVSDKFLECRECWNTLLVKTKEAMDVHQIKDVNLNFEYVEFPDEEKAKLYTELVDLFNTELDKTYGTSFITVATFADSFHKPRITDIESLGKVTDALFIMAYDFHQPMSANAGPVAPVEGKGVHSEYDLVTMLKDYLSVVPPNKIILGVPYYGYNWVVESEEELSKRIPGDDDRGFSQSQAYSDIMDLIQELKPEIKWDDLAKVPFFSYESPETKSQRQVYYENADSLKVKYDLVLANNLAGVGIWALGYDGGYQELWKLLEQEFLN